MDDTVTRHIYITGSNARMLGSEIATALRGRTIRYEVYPLSFPEILQFQDISNDPYSSTARAKMVSAFNDYLISGGYPELMSMQAQDIRRRVLQGYFDVMIYRDIIECYVERNLAALKYFIRRCVDGVSNPLSVNKVYHELKSAGYRIGKNTLYEYLDQLETVYFLQLAHKFDSSLIRRDLSDKKAYVIDNGFLTALTFCHHRNYGRLLENLTAMELRKRGSQLFYARNSHECDFIVTDDTTPPYPLQMCYDFSDQRVREREINGLVMGARITSNTKGIILTMDQEETMDRDNVQITVIPAWKFFALEKLNPPEDTLARN